jgi:hypothetical protein
MDPIPHADRPDFDGSPEAGLGYAGCSSDPAISCSSSQGTEAHEMPPQLAMILRAGWVSHAAHSVAQGTRDLSATNNGIDISDTRNTETRFAHRSKRCRGNPLVPRFATAGLAATNLFDNQRETEESTTQD